MINRMHELEKRLNNIEYNQLWNGFSKTKYALYDNQNFYINDREGIYMNLLRVQIDNKEQIIPGPVKTIIGSHIFDVKRIQW